MRLSVFEGKSPRPNITELAMPPIERVEAVPAMQEFISVEKWREIIPVVNGFTRSVPTEASINLITQVPGYELPNRSHKLDFASIIAKELPLAFSILDQPEARDETRSLQILAELRQVFGSEIDAYGERSAEELLARTIKKIHSKRWDLITLAPYELKLLSSFKRAFPENADQLPRLTDENLMAAMQSVPVEFLWFAQKQSAMKILAPTKNMAPPYFITDMKKAINKALDDKDYTSCVEIIGHIAIVLARDVEVTKDGLRLIYTAPERASQPESVPVKRAF